MQGKDGAGGYYNIQGGQGRLLGNGDIWVERPKKVREGARWLSGNSTLGRGNSQGKGPEEGGPNRSVWGTFLGGWGRVREDVIGIDVREGKESAAHCTGLCKNRS